MIVNPCIILESNIYRLNEIQKEPFYKINDFTNK